jgi:hypothetical protein
MANEKMGRMGIMLIPFHSILEVFRIFILLFQAIDLISKLKMDFFALVGVRQENFIDSIWLSHRLHVNGSDVPKRMIAF